MSTTMSPHLFRLRRGDRVQIDNTTGTVVRVTESAAVVSIPQPPRVFTTIFGHRVTIRQRPALVRVSPNAELLILNR
jgi:hypothetical protein